MMESCFTNRVCVFDVSHTISARDCFQTKAPNECWQVLLCDSEEYCEQYLAESRDVIERDI